MGRVRQGIRLLASLTGVGVVTWIGHGVVAVNATTIGFAYLLLVLVIASTWGFIEATAGSIAATLAFNYYFLEPTRTFTIADPQNWIALFSFLATSIVASRLSTETRRRTQDALERQRDLERLYAFGRAILLIRDEEPFPKQLTRRLAETFELDAVALYEPRTGEIHRAGPQDFDGMDIQLREAAMQGTVFADPQRSRVITAVRLGSEPIASLALQGGRMPDSVLQGIANLVAIGLERSKAQNLAHEVEAARRSERLRTALLDAMAHEFKTPLTSIRAATTALLANPGYQPQNAVQMLKIADEEAEHLEELIDNAVDMARLDSSHIDIEPELSNLDDVVREVLGEMKNGIGDRRIEFDCRNPLPAVAIDRRLVRLAIKQLVTNALKYSPASTPITIRVFPSDGTVALEVTDRGNGISAAEQSRVFERFYRSPSVQERIPGTGLGLSIALRISQAHEGDLTVKSQPGHTTFRMSFPTNGRGEKRG